MTREQIASYFASVRKATKWVLGQGRLRIPRMGNEPINYFFLPVVASTSAPSGLLSLKEERWSIKTSVPLFG